MALAKLLAEYETVGVWSRGLCEQWGGDPLREDPEKLRSLELFCEFAGENPDELVAFCFLRRKATGERFGSVKRRDEMTRRLREFRTRPGVPALEARRQANDVVSFLVHNGVLIYLGV